MIAVFVWTINDAVDAGVVMCLLAVVAMMFLGEAVVRGWCWLANLGRGLTRPRQAHCRFPLQVDHSRAPFTCRRVTAWLLALSLFAAGIFTGAIVYGGVLNATPP